MKKRKTEARKRSDHYYLMQCVCGMLEDYLLDENGELVAAALASLCLMANEILPGARVSVQRSKSIFNDAWRRHAKAYGYETESTKGDKK